MSKVTDLIKICNEKGKDLKYHDFDGRRILLAIAYCESSLGANNIPRFEKSYSIGGYYYKRSREVRSQFKIHGDWAACSYSSWQIMYMTARELGFKETPYELRKDEIAINFVIEFINRRVTRRGGLDLRDLADTYNSGNFWDKFIPNRYIRKFSNAYDIVLKHII